MTKRILVLIFLLVLFIHSIFSQDDYTVDIDSLFENENSGIIEQPDTLDNPEEKILETNGFSWGGTIDSSIGVLFAYDDYSTIMDSPEKIKHSLLADLETTLFFDSRPNRNFRVFGKVKADYPFKTNDLSVFELFSDFNFDEKLFFRFGKQTAGWGLSRFFQPADPVSIGVKNPENPEDDLEGPLAIKISLPINMNTLFFYIVGKDSYFPDGIPNGSVADLGLGLKGDFLVTVPENPLLGNAEVTVGAYYQQKLAPKAIMGLSLSAGNLQIFSDQVISWGIDNYILTNELVEPTDVFNSEKPENELFYSATAGFMYTNNDLNLSLYCEYFFNGSGSTDPAYLEKLKARYGAEMANQVPATLSASDLGAYQSMHNTGLSIIISELFGTDKLGFSAFWQQNWIDGSGFTVPKVSIELFDYFLMNIGFVLAWGGDDTEFILKTSDASGNIKRANIFIEFKPGCGKF